MIFRLEEVLDDDDIGTGRYVLDLTADTPDDQTKMQILGIRITTRTARRKRQKLRQDRLVARRPLKIIAKDASG